MTYEFEDKLDKLDSMTTGNLRNLLADAQTAFQFAEWKADRKRALVAGYATQLLDSNTPDTMAVLKTNLAIAEDEEYAELQQEQLRLAGICRKIKAVIETRTA